jgi:hypothetical protein
MPKDKAARRGRAQSGGAGTSAANSVAHFSATNIQPPVPSPSPSPFVMAHPEQAESDLRHLVTLFGEDDKNPTGIRAVLAVPANSPEAARSFREEGTWILLF